jgi:hypothetical protein
MAIMLTPVSLDMTKNITLLFIRMFGKEKLSYFDCYYYVRKSEIQLNERLEELYQNITTHAKEKPIGMYIFDHDDHRSIIDVCKEVKRRAGVCHDNHLHIY